MLLRTEKRFSGPMLELSHVRLDIDALTLTPCRIVIAGGHDGQTYFPYLCAARLAERLGLLLVEFPGTHAGPFAHPEASAAALRAVLAQEKVDR